MYFAKFDSRGALHAAVSVVAWRAGTEEVIGTSYGTDLKDAQKALELADEAPIELTLDETQRTLMTMHTFGGHFVKQLSYAYGAADYTNRAKLRAAFPDLFKQYGPGSHFYERLDK